MVWRIVGSGILVRHGLAEDSELRGRGIHTGRISQAATITNISDSRGIYQLTNTYLDIPTAP